MLNMFEEGARRKNGHAEWTKNGGLSYTGFKADIKNIFF